jgi:hypothetical protein
MFTATLDGRDARSYAALEALKKVGTKAVLDTSQGY